MQAIRMYMTIDNQHRLLCMAWKLSSFDIGSSRHIKDCIRPRRHCSKSLMTPSQASTTTVWPSLSLLTSRRNSKASTIKRLSAGLNSLSEWQEVQLDCICSYSTFACRKKTRSTCFRLILTYLLHHFFFAVTSHRCRSPSSRSVFSHHQYADVTEIYIAVLTVENWRIRPSRNQVGLLQDCTAGVHSRLQVWSTI